MRNINYIQPDILSRTNESNYYIHDESKSYEIWGRKKQSVF